MARSLFFIFPEFALKGIVIYFGLLGALDVSHVLFAMGCVVVSSLVETASSFLRKFFSKFAWGILCSI